MNKYLIDGEEVTKEEFFGKLEDDIDADCENNYDDILDETNDEVKLCGMTYSASMVLKRCDEIAYNCGLSDYQSNKLEDAQYDLDEGNQVIANGSAYEIVEEDEEEEN